MSAPPALPRSRLVAAGGLLVAAGALALHLGWRAVAAAHGHDARADVVELSGVPPVVWVLPLQVIALVLLRGVARPGERGARARGGLVAVGGLLLVGAVAILAVQPGAGAGALAALHLALLALAAAPPGPRAPAWPLVDDWLPAMLVGLTALMGFGFGARIQAYRLDQAAEAALAEPELALPPDAAVATELRPTEPVALPAPRSPAPIDDQDPAVGPARAPVTVVAFLDLQDEASRRLAWILTELEPRYEDRVRFVSKHLPMDADCNSKRRRTTHPRACEVAVALQCAHAQGAFRAYRHQLLRNWHAVEDGDLLAYAADLGLDGPAFTACLAGDEGTEAVEADVEQAGKGGLVDPPWLFVEGRVLEGVPEPAQVEAALAVALGERPVDDEGRAPAMLPVVVQASDPVGPTPAVAAGGTWIDPVEASLASDGRALAVLGAVPHGVDLDQARQACAASGRRLCTRAEWVAACQGAPVVDDDGDGDLFEDRREGRLQPHGDPLRAGWCSTEAVGAAGSHPACRTPEGVLDLAGNLAEWVEEGLLLGGAAGSAAGVGCHVAELPPGPGWRTATTGFRCCADGPLAAAEGQPGPPPQVPAATLPAALRDAAGPGALLVVPWRTDCASCQQALTLALAAVDGTGTRVVGLAVQADAADAREWLRRGGLPVVGVEDPQARLAGAAGVPGLPWLALYGADDRLLGSWSALPEAEALRAALGAP